MAERLTGLIAAVHTLMEADGSLALGFFTWARSFGG